MPALDSGRRWPVGEISPLVRSHDQQAYRCCAQAAAVTLEVSVEPGQRLPCHGSETTELTMKPGTNQQRRVLAGGAQSLVILELPIQKQVIPARHQGDWCPYVAYRGAVVDRLPVWFLRCRRPDILLNRRGLADVYLVGLLDREM